MKTLRYLLIVIGLASVLSVGAQGLAQQPNNDFRSTSVMVGSGSALPQAAVTGTYMTGSKLGTYSPASGHHGNMRRDVGGGGTTADDEDPDIPVEPNPIGDALLPLMLLALAYAGVRVFRKKYAHTRE